MKTFLAELAQRSLAVRTAALVLAVLAIAAGLLPIAGTLHGWAGAGAVALAGVVCLAGASAALVISSILRGPHFVLPAMLLGMLIRMGLPLSLALIVHFRGGPLAESGFLVYLLVFYPVTLTVETILSLPRCEMLRKVSTLPGVECGDSWT